MVLWLSITSNQECINRKKELFFLHPSYKNWKKWKKYFKKSTFFYDMLCKKWTFGVPCKFLILPILVEKTIKKVQKNVYFSCYFSIEFNILSRKNPHGLMGHPLCIKIAILQRKWRFPCKIAFFTDFQISISQRLLIQI